MNLLRFRRIVLIGASTLAGSGVMSSLDPGHGPGWRWLVGHVLFAVSIVAFTLAASMLVMHTTTLHRVAVGAWLVTAAGAAACIIWSGIAVVASLLAKNRADLDGRLDQVQAHTLIGPAVHGVGPALFPIGLIAILVLLAIARRSGVIALTPVLVVGATAAWLLSPDLLPVTALLLGSAVAFAGRPSPQPSDDTATPAQQLEVS